MKAETLSKLNQLCDSLERGIAIIQTETDEVVAKGDHIELIRHFKDLRDASERIKKVRERSYAIEDDLSRERIPDLLRRLKETIGLKTPIVLEGVGRVTVGHKFSCSMLDKVAGIKWLDDNGHGDLAQRTVNAQTLGAFAKDMIVEQGKDMPADIFKTGTTPYTSITKG